MIVVGGLVVLLKFNIKEKIISSTVVSKYTNLKDIKLLQDKTWRQVYSDEDFGNDYFYFGSDGKIKNVSHFDAIEYNGATWNYKKGDKYITIKYRGGKQKAYIKKCTDKELIINITGSFDEKFVYDPSTDFKNNKLLLKTWILEKDKKNFVGFKSINLKPEYYDEYDNDPEVYLLVYADKQYHIMAATTVIGEPYIEEKGTYTYNSKDNTIELVYKGKKKKYSVKYNGDQSIFEAEGKKTQFYDPEKRYENEQNNNNN